MTRHALVWELTMGALAVVYLVLAVQADEGHPVAVPALVLLSALFLAEFTLRCWAAPSRRLYVRGHWIDVVSVLPMIGGLRALRLLRLLRLGPCLKAVSLASSRSPGYDFQRDSAWAIGPLLVLLWLIGATAYWVLEHDANPNLHTFGDAVYSVFITVITLGYGDFPPKTQEGHILVGAFIFIGFGLVGYMSALLTSRWLHKRDPSAEVLARLDAIESRLVAIHAGQSTQDQRPAAKGSSVP